MRLFFCDLVPLVVLSDDIGVELFGLVVSDGAVSGVVPGEVCDGMVGFVGLVGLVGSVGLVGLVGLVGSVGLVGLVGLVGSVGLVGVVCAPGAVEGVLEPAGCWARRAPGESIARMVN